MNILFVDDELAIVTLWAKLFEDTGYNIKTASGGKEALKYIKEDDISVCFLDVKMPEMDGLELLRQIKKISPETEAVMVTGNADIQDAVSAIKEGAYDYLSKPVSFDEMEAVMKRALERHYLVNENRYLRLELGKEPVYSELIGKTPAMIQLRKAIDQAAQSSANVLIRGESGTGKELVARSIHYRGSRAKAPFVAINIAALTETLLESEIFGHEKNAFTGAADQKKGRFELANNGTLLLDEITEIPLHEQPKLLRVIQEREFERVGGTKPVKVDVRLICTTNRDLEQYVKEGNFREDFYYRINVLAINVPPLKERKEDIPLLADHYLNIYARREKKIIPSIAPAAITRLLAFDWPGNVRELMHCIESAVVTETGGTLSLESINSAKLPEKTAALGENVCSSLKELELEHIKKILDFTKGDKKKAASILGISRTTLYEKIKDFNL